MLTVDTRYFRRNEPTILGEDHMTWLYDDELWWEWYMLKEPRRTYEPIQDEM